MRWIVTSLLVSILLASCSVPQTREASVPVTQDVSQPDMPNPASVYCEEQGYRSEIRTAQDGSQSGACIFPDGSECDEWAYYRGECGPAVSGNPTAFPTTIPTALPIDPADYQGWWMYTQPIHNFSIRLPEDWVVDETTTFEPLLNGHVLSLHPARDEKLSIRMTFRRAGEDVLLWPTGVGSGAFVPQGTLDVAGKPVRRVLFVCPTGEVTAIWYHDAEEDQPNISRGGLEFGFIYSYSSCEPGYSLGGKTQRVGEMIIASLEVP